MSIRRNAGTVQALVRRAGLASVGAASILAVTMGPAQAASWSSYMTNVGPNFESSRWYTSGGTHTIQFTGCTSDSSVVNVTLAQDIKLQPDPYYSTAAFTNCLSGSNAVSTGNWGNKGAGDFYFVVNNGGWARLSVRSLTVTY
ncbi:hypothetical protein [Streptomyces sp. AB3(2024)]|uniref:hypothetical protein n=1 Tax=Streptomyces sp. AB3(2024) TaxID=3317321 RepID=UPI0035A3440C